MGRSLRSAKRRGGQERKEEIGELDVDEDLRPSDEGEDDLPR